MTKSRKVERRGGNDSEAFFERVQGRRFMPVLVFFGVLALVFLGSLFVVDYSGILDSLSSEYSLVSEKQFDVETRGIDELIEVSKGKLSFGKLELKITRTESYPTTLEAYRTSEEELRGDEDFAHYLAFRKLVVDGSVRVEYLDDNGELLGQIELSIRELLEKKMTTVHVPLKTVRRARGLRVTY